MKNVVMGIGVSAMLFSSVVSARGTMHPDSYIAVYGGQSELEVQSGGLSSGTLDGNDFGVAIRVLSAGSGQIESGLVVDFDYNSASVSRNGADLNLDRIDVGLGYMGTVGEESSWFVEAVYTAPEIEVCAGGCVSTSKSGFGVKGGFVWPFAGNWVGKASLASLRIKAKDGDNALNQGSVEASIGYKFAPNFGLNLGLRSDVYEDAEISGDEISFHSTRLIAAYTF